MKPLMVGGKGRRRIKGELRIGAELGEVERSAKNAAQSVSEMSERVKTRDDSTVTPIEVAKSSTKGICIALNWT